MSVRWKQQTQNFFSLYINLKHFVCRVPLCSWYAAVPFCQGAGVSGVAETLRDPASLVQEFLKQLLLLGTCSAVLRAQTGLTWQLGFTVASSPSLDREGGVPWCQPNLAAFDRGELPLLGVVIWVLDL